MPIDPSPGNTVQNRTGTGFTNLNKFLQANQGNQLGQSVNQGIGNTVGQFQGDLGNSVDQFNTASQANAVGTADQQANANRILNQAQNATAGSGLSDADISQYQNYEQAKYGGPTGLTNFNTLQGQAQQTQNLGQLTQSGAGRGQLLQQFAANPQYQYTQGQQNLDSLLLGGSPALQQARQQTFGLTDQANQANVNAQAQAAALQAQAGAFAQGTKANAQNAYGGQTTDSTGNPVYNGAYGNALQQVAQDQAYQTNTVNPLQQAIAANTVNATQAQLIGVDPNEITYNATPGQYFTPGNTPNINNVTSTNQQAQLNALARLSGNNIALDPSQAGTYSPFKFDTTGYQNAVNQGQQAYQNALNAKNWILDVYGGGFEKTDDPNIGGSIQDALNSIAANGGLGPRFQQQIQQAYADTKKQYGANKTFTNE